MTEPAFVGVPTVSRIENGNLIVRYERGTLLEEQDGKSYVHIPGRGCHWWTGVEPFPADHPLQWLYKTEAVAETGDCFEKGAY